MICSECNSGNIKMIDNTDENYPEVEESLQYFKCNDYNTVFHFG